MVDTRDMTWSPRRSQSRDEFLEEHAKDPFKPVLRMPLRVSLAIFGVLAMLIIIGLLAVIADAHAARFEQAPPNTTPAGTPVTFTLATDGLTVSSGVAYKLSNEAGWHRCLAPGKVSVSLPPGGYVLSIADDTSRPWFDANLPASTTPECQETTAPRNEPVSYATFVVQEPPAPRPPPVVDVCGGRLAKIDHLHQRLDGAELRYDRRHTKARRRAWQKARTAYLRSWRSYRRSGC
jgi:hypothetical protein